MDKIGKNLEIFPVDDTGLRLRKFSKTNFVFIFFVKCIEQLMKHIFGQNLEIFPAGDAGLRLRKKIVFVILLWNVQKIDEQLFRSLILKIELLKHVIICFLRYVITY